MLYIIDGYNQAIRYYHGHPSPTSALEGVFRALTHAVFSEHASHVALVLDHPAPTARQLKVPSYKANRPKRPDELENQLALLPRVGEVVGVRVLQEPGVEADDLIVALACLASATMRVIILSSDKDLYHLVGPRCTVGELPNSFMNPDRVRSKYGLEPSQLLDYLTLTGDVADNIPPVPGFGRSRSLALLKSGADILELIHDKSSLLYPHRDRVLENYWLVHPHDVRVNALDEFRVVRADYEAVDKAMKALLSLAASNPCS